QGGVWITTQGRLAGAIATASTGGTLRVDSEQDKETDPALDADPQISYATCAKLLNYPDSQAPRGSRLVPEVARSMPSVSANGRTTSTRSSTRAAYPLRRASLGSRQAPPTTRCGRSHPTKTCSWLAGTGPALPSRPRVDSATSSTHASDWASSP